MLPSKAWAQTLAGTYSVCMDSQLKISGMTAITVIIYWDWYNATPYDYLLFYLNPLASLKFTSFSFYKQEIYALTLEKTRLARQCPR